MNMVEQLKKWNACDPSIKWFEENHFSSFQEAWNECEKPDWMLWFAGKSGVDVKEIVLCALDCAEAVLHLVPEGENRPKIAVETARKYLEGTTSLEELRVAKVAAAAVAEVAEVAEVAAWAAAAARAAWAAWAAARASAWAAWAAARASAWAAWAAARAAEGKIDLCGLIRKRITKIPNEVKLS